MKNVIPKAAVLLLAGFAVLPAAGPSQKLMRANIPFAFIAGDQLQPAGEYWVGVNTDFRYVDLRSVNSVTGQRVSLAGNFTPRQGQDSTNGFLRFEQYGSTYALRAVGVPRAESGLGVRPSNVEKELAKTHGAASGVEISAM